MTHVKSYLVQRHSLGLVVCGFQQRSSRKKLDATFSDFERRPSCEKKDSPDPRHLKRPENSDGHSTHQPPSHSSPKPNSPLFHHQNNHQENNPNPSTTSNPHIRSSDILLPLIGPQPRSITPRKWLVAAGSSGARRRAGPAANGRTVG